MVSLDDLQMIQGRVPHNNYAALKNRQQYMFEDLACYIWEGVGVNQIHTQVLIVILMMVYYI